jgi:rubrerythrin
MQGELEGRELYAIAAEKVTDQKAKQVFEHLAQEEYSHYKLLQKIAEEYSGGKSIDIGKIPKPETFEDAESPIFTREFKDFLKDKHFEMSALRIGMKLELESSKKYKEMAAMTADKPLKDLFLFLSQWEEGHYQMLNKQVGFFQESYETQNSLYRF